MELLPYTFAVYDCRHLENVSSIENVHMVYLQKSHLKFFFIRCCHLHLPSLSSVLPQAFGAPELKGPLYMTSYLMFTCSPSPCITSMHPTSPAVPPWTQP